MRLPQTALLLVLGFSLAMVAGVFLGARAARRPYSATDNVASVVGLLGYSIPSFWLGMLLILVFSVKLDWLPVGGLMDVRTPATGFAMILDRARHLVLPVLALSGFHLALITRLTRGSMLEVLQLAIQHEGSTLSDGTYRNALNQSGGYQNHHRVYDRAGQPCPTCGSHQLMVVGGDELRVDELEVS